MKRMLSYLLVSIALAVVFSSCLGVSLPEDVLNTLYTVAGVIFSVGMSLTISPKTENITNSTMKKTIRVSYVRIRNLFMWFFSIDTILFIIAEYDFNPRLNRFFDLCCCIFLLFSVAYYIFNFISLQKLGEQIEDQIHREMNN